MSSPSQPEMVFCHLCTHDWPREQHGLICPHCASEFVEVIEANNDPRAIQEVDAGEEWGSTGAGAAPNGFRIGNTGSPFHPFAHTHPASRSGSGYTQVTDTPGGGFTFTTTNIQMLQPGRGNRAPDPQAALMNTLGTLLQGIMGTGPVRQPPGAFPTARSPNGRPVPPDTNNTQQLRPEDDNLLNIMSQFYPIQHTQTPNSTGDGHPIPPSPLTGLMRMLFAGHPGIAHRADGVYSQHEFDAILQSLMDQASSSGGAPPASQDDIDSVPKKPATRDMLGGAERAECTICMEDVGVGEEVSEMYCTHWFHTECIVTWLREHNTCPHCRKTLAEGQEEAEKKKNSAVSRRGESHRRSFARRTSSMRGGSGDSTNASSSEEAGGNGGSGIRDRISRMFSSGR